MLSSTEQAGLALMIFVLMLGMGATLSPKDFALALKRPKGILIGMLSQFGVMPLLAFAISKALGLPDLVAISLIMVGSTPGGTTSNLFTYFSRGDLSLSISMTVASSLASIVMMPLLVGIYVSSLDTAINVPLGKIIATIIIVLIPVCIGMLIRSKSEKKAKTLEKVGSVFGILIIAFLIISFVFREFGLLRETGVMVYLGVALLCFGGFLFGYWVSRFTGLSRKLSRTVSLETGIQNTPLTMAIILSSFPEAVQAQMMVLPLIYALSIVLYSCFLTVFYRSTSVSEIDIA
ncbi:bile acid:sodium symporter [Rubellicoccus peritrichatus]|uniref:Bile acid:sodium symporter n=1 Tax=Rubellicoccus peritrichatus TaxID=3080537 RepID=A0AAQ3QXV1_9BACT|nr:bile acid:sodium symporter [Puniceicoccus sp. CR14]WOO43427.1 bile acid:sodium symporter [Puniceicoccus sp. CR14]